MHRHLRTLFVMALAISFLAGCTSAASITPSVSPARGSFNADYAFLVKYTGTLAVASASVYIDDVSHAMREVDSGDTNYTNGKDFSYVTRLSQGSHVFYYVVVDANGTEFRSSAGVVVVDPFLDWGHFDVALVVIVFMIPLAYGLLLIRRATKALEKVAKRSEPGAGESGARAPGKDEPDSKAIEPPPKQG